jgi:hypothetical protein
MSLISENFKNSISNNSKKSKKKSSQEALSSSNKSQSNSTNHLNNITNSNAGRNKNVNKKSNENFSTLTLTQNVNNQKSREKTATFLTEEFLNASLQRNNSRNDLTNINPKKKNKKSTKQNDAIKDEKKIQQLPKSVSTPESIKKPTQSSPEVLSNKKSQKQLNMLNSRSGRPADIRDRYWAYLFDNLKRSIDEIYRTCESDNSITECNEVIHILEGCANEFRSLSSKIKLLNEYEKQASLINLSGANNISINNNTNNIRRPTSIAWEMSKSSPSKSTSITSKMKKLLESNAVQQSKLKPETGFKDFIPGNITNSNKNSKTCTKNIKNSEKIAFDDEDYYNEDIEYESK